MPYNKLVFVCGYAENACLSFLAFKYEGNELFISKEDLLINFSHNLFNLYLKEIVPYTSPNCCKTAEKGSKYCPKCGNRLEIDLFSFDAYKQWIYELHSQINDGCPQFDEDMEDWTAFVYPINEFFSSSGEVVVINEKAETLFPALLDFNNHTDLIPNMSLHAAVNFSKQWHRDYGTGIFQYQEEQ